MSETTLIILFLVASFACAGMLFWLSARVVNTSVDRYRSAFSDLARSSLEEMFLFIDSSRLLTLNAIIVVVAGLLGWLLTGSPVIAAGCCALGLAAPRMVFQTFRKRRIARLRAQLPDAIMVVSGSLRAGVSLQGALVQMVEEARPPVSQEFELVLREQRLGVSFEDAIDHLEQRVPIEDVTLLSAAMKVARETGGNLAETLDRLAGTLRQKLIIEGKIAALTSQGKLQGIVVGMLPIGLMLVLSKMEPEAMHPLFTRWYGWVTIAVIIIMETIGALIIRKIVAIDI